MDTAPSLVEADSSLQRLVFEHLLRSGHRPLVVVGDGRPLGLIDAATVKTVPRDLWPTTPVRQVLRPIPSSVSPDTEVAGLLDRLDRSTGPVPVVAGERLVGVVDLGQILRYAELADELHVAVGTPRPAAA
jgi:CBS domain-containing protein